MVELNRRILYLLVGAFGALSLYAGNIVKVHAVYEYVSNNPNETPEQAERMAFERARQKALEDRFGMDVSSVNSTLIQTRSENRETASYTDVFALGGVAVRGEWIETTQEDVISKTYTDGFWIVRVEVAGRARNRSAAKTEISYALLNNSHDRTNRTQYYDGDDIFLRFSSPVSGALCVYLVDENRDVFCLLPYMANTTGCQKIDANKEYLFFSADTDKNAVEYTLNTQRSSEQNAIYIIFSPNTFSKARDKQSAKNWRNEDMPRQLSYADFLKWLEGNQIKDAEMVVVCDVISIKNKP